MHITRVSDNFYSIENVLSNDLAHKLIHLFTFREHWSTLTDANFNRRSEYNILMKDTLAGEIGKELDPLKTLIEDHTGTTLYQNAPQLWFDHVGYLSSLHKDFSPNLAVNVQVYLTNGNQDIGTHCCDNDTWYSVPYKYNCGYILIGPTERLHGMKTPVVDQRLSLYQSYRSTEVPANIW